VTISTDRVRTDYRLALQELIPELNRRLDRTPAAQGVPEDTVRDLHTSGLFRMRVPRELGGGDVDARTAFESVETLSHLDGATGWTFMAGSSLLGLAGAFLPESAAELVFADPAVCIAGQVAPRGRAEADGTGYQIEGDFGFGSGAAHSSYMLGGFREILDGKPVRTPDGLPRVLVALIPSERIRFLGNWDVLGLQRTGSVDYRVPRQLTAGDFTWPLFSAEPRRGGPLYRMGVYGVTAIDHAAFSVGVAQRALDEVSAMALEKKRAGRALLVDDPIFQYEFARAQAALLAARAFALDAIGELERAAAVGAINRTQRARARLAATHAAATAVDVTGVAYRFSGSTGLRNGSAIQQCLRDLTASEAHVFTDHNTWRDSAAVLLGVAPDNAPI
jgi:alkylation response protein AidB-like acyl-CoA dehydrogenase